MSSRSAPCFSPRSGGADAELSNLQLELDPARTRASEARSKFSETEREQRELEQKLGRGYGEGDVFAPLADKCYSAKASGSPLGPPQHAPALLCRCRLPHFVPTLVGPGSSSSPPCGARAAAGPLAQASWASLQAACFNKCPSGLQPRG